MTQRPLEGRYGAMLASALLALIPFILVMTAGELFRKPVMHDLDASAFDLQIASGLATAGYAFGALLGGDLINRFAQRRLFLTFQALFVAGCAATALAPDALIYSCGRVVFGFATGVMLVSALPPVIRRFPARQMPITSIFINIAFFGAVMAGPLIGGAISATGAWRAFYGALSAIGLANFVLAFTALPDQKPFNRDLPFDLIAIVLGLAATALPFWGAAELTGHGFAAPLFWAPMGVGLAAFLALLLTEYYRKNALSPVKHMWSTFPVVGTLAAMVGGGVLVTFLMLAVETQIEVVSAPPVIASLSFWPQILGVLIAAMVVGWALTTRYLPLVILAGMLLLLGAGGLLLAHNAAHAGRDLLAASGLLGLGAGLTVAPGLFMAGLPLPSIILGRIFALIELVRSLADFILAPVVVKIARLGSHGAALTPQGVNLAITITMVFAATALVFGAALFMAGRPGLPQPNLEDWLQGGKVAIRSPPLAAALRPKRHRN